MKILKIKKWLLAKRRNEKLSELMTKGLEGDNFRTMVANQYRGFVSDEWIDKNILNK